VIDPCRLRSMVENCDKFGKALQRIGSSLDLSAGSDLTAACVPAIKALKEAANPSEQQPYAYEIGERGRTQQLAYPAYLERYATDEERAMPRLPLYASPVALHVRVQPSDPLGSYRDATGELVLPVRRGWACEDSGVESC
jgi:hypothetical protein